MAGLYEEYYPKVSRYIFIRIGNQQEAEDLASETFVRALASLDSYEERGSPLAAWLFRIAHNIVVDYVRKMSKRPTVTLEEVTIADSSNPEEVVEIDIQTERLAQAMEHLTPAQREILGLRFFSDLSAVDTGKILGKKPGAVREMQRAAISTLRMAMGSQS